MNSCAMIDVLRVRESPRFLRWLRMLVNFVLSAGILCSLGLADEGSPEGKTKGVEPAPVMLVPGFSIIELPIELTSLNNVEYAADGRLFGAGYDGRFHLLQDTDRDGLEDSVKTFWDQSSPNYPLGMVVKDGIPHAVLTDEIVRFIDTDRDGVPDKKETLIRGFDDPVLVEADYLHHRRVDSSMAIAIGPDDSWYVTMGNAGYNNPYWHDKKGVRHYSIDQRRGCLLKIDRDGKVEQLASGLRYVMSLQWNRHGDLFGTDQEGATWCPNGNPFDELLHLVPGRHYGFPPNHPEHLPKVIDEPSAWDYGPQHQSTCGFRFNTPTQGNAAWGPSFWQDDAIVTGESRGNLWRTALSKTKSGYVAKNDLIAKFPYLIVDCTISPDGQLVVCCHTGKPDWGNGPNGQGKLYKIRYQNPMVPQPVLAWASSETETVVAFDRPLSSKAQDSLSTSVKMEYGKYVEAGDRHESIRPGYVVVQMQQRERRSLVSVKTVKVSPDRRSLIIASDPRREGSTHSLSIAGLGSGEIDMAYALEGVEAEFRGDDGSVWKGWLPHLDPAVSRDFTRGSALHDELWQHAGKKGKLVMRTSLQLANLLHPVTQPGSTLDYVPPPESVSIQFEGDAPMLVESKMARVESLQKSTWRWMIDEVKEDRWIPLEITVDTPMHRLDVSYSTKTDPRPRALSTRRFMLPFAQPGDRTFMERSVPELAGGDWEKGRELFRGKAACSTCHVYRGEGFSVGPDLNNLVHRDYASVRRDLLEPNAVLNPDAIAYLAILDSGSSVVGTRFRENQTSLELSQQLGKVAKLNKDEIEVIKPMSVSMMPSGLEKFLSETELRDLMTYLMIEPSQKR